MQSSVCFYCLFVVFCLLVCLFFFGGGKGGLPGKESRKLCFSLCMMRQIQPFARIGLILHHYKSFWHCYDAEVADMHLCRSVPGHWCGGDVVVGQEQSHSVAGWD